MKDIGYERLISLDNFRNPNFELVADILCWMVEQLKIPNNMNISPLNEELSDDISTREHRIQFILNACAIIQNVTQIKLRFNLLFRADAYAVKELLKIAQFLNKAQKIAIKYMKADDEKDESLNVNSIDIQLQTLRESKNIGSEIVGSGVRLHNFLQEYEKGNNAKHMLAIQQMMHQMRNLNLESNIIHNKIEERLREQITQITDETQEMNENIKELKLDEKQLNEKIKSKRNEFQRLQKRFESLKNIKPAFMAEYENAERVNLELYKEYCVKYRNMCYLQSRVNSYRMLELDAKRVQKQRLRKVQKRLRNEEMRILRGEEIVDDGGQELIAIMDDNTFDGLVDDLHSTSASSLISENSKNDEKVGYAKNRMSMGYNQTRSLNQNMNESTSGSISDENSFSGSSHLSEDGSMTVTGTENISTVDSNTNSTSLADEDSIGSISDLGDELLQF